MPFDPVTGIYTRPTNSFSQPLAGTIIDNADADALFDDYDFALNNAGAGGVGALPIFTGAGAINISTLQPGVLVNKAIAAPTTVNIPSAASRNAAGVNGVGKPILVKDLKGDAGTNLITIVPASGTIDGFADFSIGINFGWVRLFPLADGSGYWVGP